MFSLFMGVFSFSRMRRWSVRNARWLISVYNGVEWALVQLDWLLRWIGHDRLEKPFVAIEKISKGFLLDSRNCGQCIVGSTGLSCPMNCLWVLAWEGNKRMGAGEYPIQIVQPPVDNPLIRLMRPMYMRLQRCLMAMSMQ